MNMCFWVLSRALFSSVIHCYASFRLASDISKLLARGGGFNWWSDSENLGGECSFVFGMYFFKFQPGIGYPYYYVSWFSSIPPEKIEMFPQIWPLLLNHHHRQNSAFWAIAFLKRFCQIWSGFHFFEFHNNIFFQSKVVSFASNPPTWRTRSLIYVFQRQAGPVIPPGTRFSFRCLLRLAGLWWRYSNQPAHGNRY
jgi:hypothetical protein